MSWPPRIPLPHVLAAALIGALGIAAVLLPAWGRGAIVGAQAAPGVFTSTPQYSSGGLASVVFSGGTIDQLESAGSSTGATGVWAQGPSGSFELLVVGAPPFLRDAFLAKMPATFGLVAVTLVRGAGSPVSSTGGAPVPSSGTSGAAPQYGDRYANGVLPVGDGRYTTAGPKQGSIYVCNANFVPAGQAGAQVKGFWFLPDGVSWSSTKKIAVLGAVPWPNAAFSMNVSGGRRVITTNGLPTHTTGTFPVSPSDPASQFDRNPNRITAQSLTYDLPANPTGMAANCIGGEAGVMLDGVPLFNGFDAGGRDAQAWEIQDSCGGHPQRTGEYHYHGLSPCATSTDARTVIGFALDGYPITGPRVAPGNVITSADLDECHGMTSEIVLDGNAVTSYHYVMTQDFPYSIACFRGQPIRPPGMPGG